jgi:hypothetical protein
MGYMIFASDWFGVESTAMRALDFDGVSSENFLERFLTFVA